MKLPPWLINFLSSIGIHLVKQTVAKYLEHGDIDKVAERIAVPPAGLRALYAVETRGTGFEDNGRPKILFEAHWFSRLTQGRYDKSHPNISATPWDRSLYIGGPGEWKRFEQAAKLDREAAIKATSWGLFQIMGFNHSRAGYPDVESFYTAMCESELNHLNGVADFLVSRGLDDAMRRGDVATLATGYNGPGYKKNRWDEKYLAALQANQAPDGEVIA